MTLLASSPRRAPALALLTLALTADAKPVEAAPTLEQYRYFRALSIDLVGRLPTRDEVAAFEKPGFSIDAWIEQHLDGPAYVQRLERIYMDALRLETGPAFLFVPTAATLNRVPVLGPNGKQIYIYFRNDQRRLRPETDGDFCLTPEETGLKVARYRAPEGTPIPVAQKVLDANTVLVRPWWLYRDYLTVSPTQRYGASWDHPDEAYVPIPELQHEPDGKTPTVEVRVCKEEAQTEDVGHFYVSGRPPPAKGAPLLRGRLRPPPYDDPYAKAHKGEPLSCRSSLANTMSVDCGCGIGLQYCMPGDNWQPDARAFALPTHVPLGVDNPIGLAHQTLSSWYKFWWSQEAIHFMDYLFGTDRDFREMLTGRYTFINGPLAQFYLSGAPASCCNQEKPFGLREAEEHLFMPSAVPNTLSPHDVSHWVFVPDRGPHAAGIMTTPAFLSKYASRRARGAALYSAFLCKSFVAEHADLPPSTEPNLMIRPGCSSCHATLEPLAAYFSRVEETSWTFLPPKEFPIDNPLCKLNPQGKQPGFCAPFYDPSFSDKTHGKLRGAYASVDHTERGPVGAAADLTSAPEFASCAVERVTSSLLGRPLRDDDQALLRSLRELFVARGYRMRPLVSAILRSPAYASVNNVSPAVERSGGAP